MKAVLALKTKIIIGCLSVAAAGTAITAGVLLNNEDMYRILKVFEMSGPSMVMRESAGDLDAYEGMNLEGGDSLHVGEESNLRLCLDNDKYMLLDSGTVVELEAEGSESDSRTSVNLIQGTILNEITNKLSENSSYEVNTPKATMAVRGTSFTVTVEGNDVDGYITHVNVINGNVSVQLYNEDGKPKGQPVIAGEGKSVSITTDPNDTSGNAPAVDGIANFVIADSDGNYVVCDEDDDPVYTSDYSTLSSEIKNTALDSNDTGLLILDDVVEQKLRSMPSVTETSAETAISFTQQTSVQSQSPQIPQTPAVSTNATTPAFSAMTTTASTVTSPVVTSEAVTTTAPAETEETVTTTPISEETSETTVTVSVTEETTVTTTETETTTTSETTLSYEEYMSSKESATTTTATETAQTYTSPTFTNNTTYQTTYNTTYYPQYTTSYYFPEVTTVTTVPTEPEFTYDTITSAVTTDLTQTVPTETTTVTTTEPIPITTVDDTVYYNVTFLDELGNTVYSEEVAEGSLLTNIPAVPEKPYHTGKWMYNNMEYTGGPVMSDMTIIAAYTSIEVTVSFIFEDGSQAAAPITIDAGTSLGTLMPDVPAKPYHTGVWSVNGIEFTADTIVTAETVVTAVYTVGKATVSFIFEDGSQAAAPITIDAGTSLGTLIPDVPAKPYHTGVWSVNGIEFTADTIVTADTVVTAVYTVGKATVSFIFEDGSQAAAPITIDAGTSLDDLLPTVPDNPDAAADEASYYTGIWKSDGTEFTADTIVTADTVVTAVYTRNKVTVSFKFADGTLAAEPIIIDAGTSLDALLPAVPNKPDVVPYDAPYYEGKWLTSSGTEFTSDTLVTSNITLKTDYTPVKIYLPLKIPHYTPQDTYSYYEYLTVDYGKTFAENDQGMTYDELIARYNDPETIFPDNLYVSSWTNYDVDTVKISDKFRKNVLVSI